MFHNIIDDRSNECNHFSTCEYFYMHIDDETHCENGIPVERKHVIKCSRYDFCKDIINMVETKLETERGNVIK